VICFTFLVLAHPDSPRQRAVKHVVVVVVVVDDVVVVVVVVVVCFYLML